MIQLAAGLLSLLAQAGPVSYYKGDDTPPDAVDSSPAARLGTYTNGATTDPFKPTLLFANATSMKFDGADDVVDVATTPWPATGGPVTVAFWNFVPTGGVQNSSAFTLGADGNERFQAHAPWGDNILYWDYGNIGGAGRISVDYAPRINLWTHVALVSEGNGGAFKGIYINGALAASAATSDGPDIALTGLQIGSWGGTRHRGQIDDFRIYDRVLTAAQIQLLHQGHTEPGAPAVNISIAPGQADLSWAPVPGAASYLIQRSLNGLAFADLATVTTTSYTDTPIAYGATVVYRVAAIGVSRGPFSSNVGGTIPSPTPRVEDHEEGLLDENCSCGAAAAGAWMPWSVLALVLLGIGRRSNS